MKTYRTFLLPVLCILALAAQSCSFDDRLDDLKGGYEGAFIDKVSGDTVATEFYGAKVRLLDLEYGDVAVPLEYKALPDGSFRNTKVYPSKYKIYGVGPFFEQDTLEMNLKKQEKFDIMVTPNMALQIKSVEMLYGIAARVTLAYTVNDQSSASNDIGFVYSKDPYPGQRNAMLETESNALVYKRMKSGIKNKEGEITETFYLEPNTKYYFRAVGRTQKGGDYWNFSKQEIISTKEVDLSSLPIEFQVGVSSATSAILQWAFPPVVDNIRLSYTDRDGEKVEDIFSPTEKAYVANLPHDTQNKITVQLLSGDTAGPEQVITVKTKKLNEKYVPTKLTRPANVPFFNDVVFRWSLSWEWALIEGPRVGEDWSNNSSRHMFFSWWDGWDWAAYRMPSCGDIEDCFTELSLAGEVMSLVDILPFVNLETLNISKGTNFDPGYTVHPDIDLRPLSKLKKLKTVNLHDVPLTKASFEAAGLKHLTINKD